VFGNVAAPTRPDLAIEVIWTSGGIDKAEVYRKLDVPEVWIWRRGRIDVHVLTGERYQPAEASTVLRGIDLDELARFVDRPTTSAAIREYRSALQARRG
jgi:Uma2 family endonuclease